MASQRQAAGRRLPSPGVGLLLVAAAVVFGIYDFIHVAGFGFGPGYEMAAIAQSLAEHGTYANPFQPSLTGPTALVPPLFPFVLAGLMWILGHSPLMVIAAVCLNIASNAFIAWLLPRVSMAFYGSNKPGVLGAILWLFSMRLMPEWDLSFTIAGLISFCLLARIAVRRGAMALTCAAGLLGGLVLLANPTAASVIAMWMAFLFIVYRPGLRRAVKQGAVMALVAAVCLAPWLVRNYRTWHAIILRNSFGITLYTSNNDCASSSLPKERRSGCFDAVYPMGSVREVGMLRQMGEVSYDGLKKTQAVDWIRSHPARFAQLTAERFVEFWFPDPDPYWFRSYVMWMITVLSLPGAILMFRHRQRVSIFVLGVWLLYPPIYYVMVSSDRYRYPILWTSLLPAGYFLEWLSQRIRVRSSAASPAAPNPDAPATAGVSV